MNLPLPIVVMPSSVQLAQREAWLLAGALYQRVPDGWTIVGGQMVQFHGWRTGTVPTRTTTDLDAGIAARANPSAFRILSAALQDLGLQPVLHPTGIEHRWYRLLDVACHEHGTGVAGFLPGSWDHLDCQSWDHPACRAGGSWVGSLDRRVGVAVMEVYGRGIQGGQCG